jgi:hypothetical protein
MSHELRGTPPPTHNLSLGDQALERRRGEQLRGVFNAKRVVRAGLLAGARKEEKEQRRRQRQEGSAARMPAPFLPDASRDAAQEVLRDRKGGLAGGRRGKPSQGGFQPGVGPAGPAEEEVGGPATSRRAADRASQEVLPANRSRSFLRAR